MVKGNTQILCYLPFILSIILLSPLEDLLFHQLYHSKSDQSSPKSQLGDKETEIKEGLTPDWPVR